jgi:dTDP-4-dehydrorhamnose reductase
MVTGANGVVGTAMVKYLKALHVEVIEWDRKQVSPFKYNEMKAFIASSRPDILFHFAMASNATDIENESWKINYEWTSELAWITKELSIKFLFTSTAMVFSNFAKGPFTQSSLPDAKEGYGFEKMKAEEKAFQQNANSYIVRLGWQIGEEFYGNNMLAYCENEYHLKGRIKASGMWYPACSIVNDTVAELYRLVNEEMPGLYMLDSNDKYSFFEIVSMLNNRYNNRWKVVRDDSFIFDQRMLDDNIKIAKLSTIFNEQ